MGWCFAIINGRLAEIYFEKRRNKNDITAHCYVKRSEFKTKQEKRWIKEDTARCRLVYLNKKYRPVKA